MRALLFGATASAVISVAGVVLTGTHASAARGGGTVAAARCHPPGSRTVLRHKYLTVYSVRSRQGPRVFACPQPKGARLTLAYSSALYGPEKVFPRPAVRIAGRTVGWAVTFISDGGGDFATEGDGHVTLVKIARFYPPGTDPKRRGWVTLNAEQASTSAYSSVGSIAVRPSLDLAWITCPPPRRRGRDTCSKPGHRDTVYVKPHLEERIKVAWGRDIDPRSLERRGNVIEWTQAGHRRSAPFPP